MSGPCPNVVAETPYGPLIVSTQDIYISRSIIEGRYWDENNIRLLEWLARAKLRAKSVIRFYDVGANIGTHTLALARRLGSAVDIRAFEAQRALFHMLCGTLALNNLHNVSAHHNAVADRDEDILRIALPDYGQPNNLGGLELIPPHRSDNGSMQKSGQHADVRTVSLDSFGEDVDVIKLDVEGMELLALQGATKTIERSRPIFAVELLKSNAAEIRSFFASRGYEALDQGDDSFFLPRELNLGLKRA